MFAKSMKVSESPECFVLVRRDFKIVAKLVFVSLEYLANTSILLSWSQTHIGTS